MAHTPAVKGPSKSLSVTIPQGVYEFLDVDRFEPDVRMDRGDFYRKIVVDYAMSRGYKAEASAPKEGGKTS